MSLTSSTKRIRKQEPSTQESTPLLTIFALPKPFLGHIGVIQRNALRSWLALGDRVEVILFGDEAGTAHYAEEFDMRHVPEIRRNEQGTPLLDDVFATAAEMAKSDMLLYANSDIVFTTDLLKAVERVHASDLREFLLIGRRIDLDLDEMIDFEQSGWEQGVIDLADRNGTLAPVVCKDYFGFARGQYASIPAFAVGRGNWDNWMVHHANESRIPVIDCTSAVTAIHQNHGYQHLRRGRLEAYVNGPEAEHNRRLAGGRHLVTGSGATWQLSRHDMGPLNRSISSSFFRDLPGFMRLLKQLFLGRERSTLQPLATKASEPHRRIDSNRALEPNRALEKSATVNSVQRTRSDLTESANNRRSPPVNRRVTR